MQFFPHEFNGFLFQQGPNNRVASEFATPYDWTIGGISTNNALRDNAPPKFSGKVHNIDTKVVTVHLKNGNADRPALVTAMDIGGSQQHPLYALDELGNEHYVNAVCVGLNLEVVDPDTGTASFGYVFEVDDAAWKSVEEVSTAWNVTATGDTVDIFVSGNQPARATFQVTPTTTPAGYYPYREYIKNYNPVPRKQRDGIDITNGGWDTGYDVFVFVDGAVVPCWVGGGGWNSASTKIFITLTWQPGQSLPLRTAISNVGTPTLIQWAKTPAVKAALGKMPVNGIVRINNEEFSYRNRNATTCQAGVVSRSIRGTSAGSHSVGDLAWWVEHDIQIVYGNGSATAPSYSDVEKPVFSLTSSTNISRVYTEFADANGKRAGSFVRQVLNDGIGKLNRVYSGNQGAIPEVDPATDMGMEIDAYQAQGRWKPETAELAWLLYHPAGITTVTSAGEKYKALATTTWPTIAALESSAKGVVYVSEWNETVPASANTWTAWTHNNEAVPAGTLFIRFHFKGSVNALASNRANMEVDSATIALDPAGVIQIGMSGEIGSYRFDAELENVETEESLLFDYPIAEDRTLIVDTEELSATYLGMNAIRGVDTDEIRADMLLLMPGWNTLRYTVTSLTGNVSWLITFPNRNQ
jgi:hypothetical protein